MEQKIETTKIALFKGKKIRKILYNSDDWIEKRMRGIFIREELIGKINSF